MSKPSLLEAYTPETLSLRSCSDNYAIIRSWTDNNSKSEARLGYFVSLSAKSQSIEKAKSKSDVLGVTVSSAGIIASDSSSYRNSAGQLLPKYSCVALYGIVNVKGNGSCLAGGRCIPNDEGIAVPTDSDVGYPILSVGSYNEVTILLTPNVDVINRVLGILDEVLNTKLKLYSGTLKAGDDTLEFTGDQFTENGDYEFYTSIWGVSPREVIVSNGSLKLFFNVQSEDMVVKVGVR